MNKVTLNYNIEFEKNLEYIVKSIISSANIKYIYLFGSFAYGNPNQYSDIDIYIVKYNENRCNSLIHGEIMDKLSIKKLYYVDIIIYSEEAFNKRKEYTLEKMILSKGKLIYEN